MVSIPSFAQSVEIDPVTVTPVGVNTMPMYGRPNKPLGDPCNMFTNCDSSGGDDDDDYDECGNKSNGLGKDGEQCDNPITKEDYCQIVEDTMSLFSGMRIIGTANTILSLGGIAGGFGLNTLSAGIVDIETFIGNGIHAPPQYGELASINWLEANIDWSQYDDSWNELDGRRPTRQNGGAEHIMAVYFQNLGIGSGPNTVTPPSNFLPQDPEPGVSCN